MDGSKLATLQVLTGKVSCTFVVEVSHTAHRISYILLTFYVTVKDIIIRGGENIVRRNHNDRFTN